MRLYNITWRTYYYKPISFFLLSFLKYSDFFNFGRMHPFEQWLEIHLIYPKKAIYCSTEDGFQEEINIHPRKRS